ncbi:MAG: class I SAM-dependent methyltransferase [Acidimicrobiales bacterium]|jgi:SAM-dependent methyltransferase
MDVATVAVYERSASEWRRRRGEATDGLGREFRERVGNGPVADLGCGAGRYLAEIGRPVVGVDATFAMLSLARSRVHPLAQGDLESLPFADGVLAGIFARHSYLHLPKARLGHALAEAGRVLRPGGLFLATLIAGNYEGYELPGDDFPGRYFACWTAAELTATLAGAGFVDVSVVPIDRPQGRADLLATSRR